MPERRPGAAGFDDAYWRTCYAVPDDMDGVGNAAAHAAYLKASFDVVLGEVRSLADLGFGLGVLFREVLRVVRPYRAYGLEPSRPAYDAVAFQDIAPEGTRLTLERVDLVSWCRRPDAPRWRFDLGVCTSVLQYLGDDELEVVIPVLARRFRWLYLTVPTDLELERQEADGFFDPYALRRPAHVWRDLLAPHFTPVGARLLESRVTVREEDSRFTDRLYRGW